MAAGSSLTQNYFRSQSEIQGDLHRGTAIGLIEGGFSFLDRGERLGRNISTVNDCWEQWSRDGTASRRPGSRWSNDTTDLHILRTAVAHHAVFAAEIRTAVGTPVTQRTVRNRLFQGQLRARCPVAHILLNPSHCRFLRQWCHARAHWRTE
ncbi:HTH_Tnp_Tc3_2 domain-containing protein [Trichonephila clavipes]|nr:HTH_Tnp_Tc3_2 domain-containing protein [Trichonephila clavipes]